MKNTIENIIIALVVFIAGSFTGAYVAYKATSESMLKLTTVNNEVIKQAISKATTEIINHTEIEMRRMKLKKGSAIDIKPEPTPDSRFRLFKKDKIMK